MQWDALFALIVALGLVYVGLNPQIFIPCAKNPCVCEPWDLLCQAACLEQQGEEWLCSKFQFAFGAFAMIGALFALLMSVVGALT